MSDLRNRIAEALYEPPDTLVVESAFGGLVLGEAKRQARERADKVMPIVGELATELNHAEQYIRRLEQQIKQIKGEK